VLVNRVTDYTAWLAGAVMGYWATFSVAGMSWGLEPRIGPTLLIGVSLSLYSLWLHSSGSGLSFAPTILIPHSLTSGFLVAEVNRQIAGNGVLEQYDEILLIFLFLSSHLFNSVRSGNLADEGLGIQINQCFAVASTLRLVLLASNINESITYSTILLTAFFVGYFLYSYGEYNPIPILKDGLHTVPLLSGSIIGAFVYAGMVKGWIRLVGGSWTVPESSLWVFSIFLAIILPWVIYRDALRAQGEIST